MSQSKPSYALAFDTANETVAIGIGVLNQETRTITEVATQEVYARRQSNTTLLPQIEALFNRCEIKREQVSCVICGRGPGSFTGVRIAMATAKGLASAWEVALGGVSSLDAVAWNAWSAGKRGRLTVVADAMRHEIYPAQFDLLDSGVLRLDPDTVIKVEAYAESFPKTDFIAGDALEKYLNHFVDDGSVSTRVCVLEKDFWAPTGKGLLLAAQAKWQDKSFNPFDKEVHNPGVLLPVYTRLSDAEENERIRLAKENTDVKTAQNIKRTGEITYRPFEESQVNAIVQLEALQMGSSAWSPLAVRDELGRKNRSWWTAFEGESLVGYAGGFIADGNLQILKVATAPTHHRQGIARRLVQYVASDARDLGASSVSLEVRASNEGAQAFYRALSLQPNGVRPRYYSDGEDAIVMVGPLPLAKKDVAGMSLQDNRTRNSNENQTGLAPESKPQILALETSCDETAAALIDGKGVLHADILASQIDFHARFGGVVPEIASRKHIEAICGVAEAALEQAKTSWKELDAIASTYAPGLVGALVVGVAFSKAAAWALDIPYIQVNHLEGHIYANKIPTPDLKPPLVVSLVSGGHTMLVEVRDWGDYHILGQTLDDAVGEAFDKVAKALGLGYPGGPVISKEATRGNPKAIDFPRAMLHSGDLRFSLSGLKTAVITYIEKERQAGNDSSIPDIAASFQQAVIDVQVAKARTALQQTGAKEFCLGGGVAANQELRQAYEKMCAEEGVRLTLPPLTACTDNAGMIALVALDRFRETRFASLDADAHAQASLESSY